MKSARMRAVAVSLVFLAVTSRAGFFSADWWNKNVAKPVQKDIVKPTEKALVSAGQTINKEVIKPTEKAFVQLGQDINKQVIQPIDFNVIKPTVGVADTIVNVVDMAILIKNMIPPIQQVIENITTQIIIISKVKNGTDIVDPIFATVQQLTKLPPHFQAILNKIASSLSAIEDIARPTNAAGANNIKAAAEEIRSISKSVDEMTRKIIQLNEMLYVRVKAITHSATAATTDILAIIK